MQTERNKCALYLIVLCLISWVKFSIRCSWRCPPCHFILLCIMRDDDSFIISRAHLLLSHYSLLAMILLRRYVHCSRSLSMHCICVEPLCVSICVFFCIMFQRKHWQVVDGIIPSLSTPTLCTHIHTQIQYTNAETRLMTIGKWLSLYNRQLPSKLPSAWWFDYCHNVHNHSKQPFLYPSIT